MNNALNFVPGELTLDMCADVAAGLRKVKLDVSAKTAVDASVATVKKLMASGASVYGVNTGFGKFSNFAINTEDLATLQRNIVLSHAAGVGEPLADYVVRLCLLLKINSLARGFSGVRMSVIERLLYMLNENILPIVPSQGSVGASGDLAPLAHLALPLLGLGAVSCEGEYIYDVSAVLKKHKLDPITLGPKEGLALLNGTQVSTAIAVVALLELTLLFSQTLVIGALTTCAVAGNPSAFDSRIHAARGQKGQIVVAAELLRLVKDAKHIPRRLQDPYSIRCQPQVMGACLDAMDHAEEILTIEINAVTDNPILFTDTGEALSGGNFHAEPIAFVADHLALAIAEIGSLSERRLALMLDYTISGLPPFLANNGGLCSGFMIAQVTAAALVSENKMLAAPASVDSIPTSANQEDHVSMATHAAMRLHKMIDNLRHIVAIEALAAAQACQLIGNEKKLPAALLDVVEKIASSCGGIYQDDAVLADKIMIVNDLLLDGEMADISEL